LHLDAAAISRDEPLIMRDLERVCTTCGSKRRCVRDLVRYPDDQAWRAYCPNAMTLDALDDRNRRSTREGDIDIGRNASL
jgi:hypothetical protein